MRGPTSVDGALDGHGDGAIQPLVTIMSQLLVQRACTTGHHTLGSSTRKAVTLVKGRGLGILEMFPSLALRTAGALDWPGGASRWRAGGSELWQAERVCLHLSLILVEAPLRRSAGKLLIEAGPALCSVVTIQLVALVGTPRLASGGALSGL